MDNRGGDCREEVTDVQRTYTPYDKPEPNGWHEVDPLSMSNDLAETLLADELSRLCHSVATDVRHEVSIIERH